jgi:hypothetical protein
MSKLHAQQLRYVVLLLQAPQRSCAIGQQVIEAYSSRQPLLAALVPASIHRLLTQVLKSNNTCETFLKMGPCLSNLASTHMRAPQIGTQNSPCLLPHSQALLPDASQLTRTSSPAARQKGNSAGHGLVNNSRWLRERAPTRDHRPQNVSRVWRRWPCGFGPARRWIEKFRLV